MATESTSSQRIPWRRRADLQVAALEFSGRPSWGIKDPITLAYFELNDEEYFVLQRLDGMATFDDVCREFNDRFRPTTLDATELQRFLGQLVSQGLLAADGPGYGRALATRNRQRGAHQRWAALSNVLCIRFRGVDPDRLLEWLLQRCGWLFSRTAVAVSIALIVAAITLVLVQFERVVEMLPDARVLLSTQNLIWLPLLMAMVKILHEFGHGLTCKKFGGECRELGAMLLVFTPTLYCNVSDMWMVGDKWKRIAVSAAGMWVEAVIASICTLLWWFSTPGVFHSMCLNLMFVCGVSTILFNGNPLLRYDGYFVLSDWLEIPNLQQQSMGTLKGGIAHWFCGIRGNSIGESFHRRWLLVSYGIASMLYRLILMFVILWSLYYWLQPYGLGPAVQLMAVPMVGLMMLTPLASAIQFFRSPENRQQIDWTRFRFRAPLVLGLVVCVLAIPVPIRISAGALVDQDTAERVYAPLGGTLEASVKVGDRVEAGQQIALLTDPSIRMELVRLEGELQHHRLQLQQLERRRVFEPAVAALIPAVRSAVEDYENQLQTLRETADRLVLKAPCGGLVLPSDWNSPVQPEGSLPSWVGSPLDDRNRGCFIKPGTAICRVGPAESRAAMLLINQDDINLVRVGQRVRIAWQELPGQITTGEIVEIAALDLDRLPRDAVRRLNLPARSGADGTPVPVGTWYLGRAKLDERSSPVLHGFAGQARVLTDPASLGSRAVRWLQRTFPL